MSIRHYILTKSLEEAGYQFKSTSLPQDLNDSKDIIVASSNIMREVAATRRTALGVRTSYTRDMNDLQKRMLDEYHSKVKKEFLKNPPPELLRQIALDFTGETSVSDSTIRQLKGDNRFMRVLAGHAEEHADEQIEKYTDEDHREEFLQDLHATNDAKIIRMEKAIGNMNIATESISAFNSSLEQVYSIADIVNSKMQDKKNDAQRVKNAKDILKQSYAIKEEGTNRLNSMLSELDKMDEAILNEGFFKNLADAVIAFFGKLTGSLNILKRRAEAL